MPEITPASKFTDVVRWITDWWNNVWPPVYEDVKSMEGNANDARAAATDAAGYAQEAAQAAQAAQNLVHGIPLATTTTKGMVQYADSAALAAGDATRAVTADQLKETNYAIDQISAQGAPDATDVIKGISTRATAALAIDGADNEAHMTAATTKAALDHFGQNGNISADRLNSGVIPHTALPVATTSENGAMSAADKIKLDAIMHTWTGSQAQYDALGVYDNNTLYFIEE